MWRVLSPTMLHLFFFVTSGKLCRTLCVVPELLRLCIYQSVDFFQLDTWPTKYGHIELPRGLKTPKVASMSCLWSVTLTQASVTELTTPLGLKSLGFHQPATHPGVVPQRTSHIIGVIVSHDWLLTQGGSTTVVIWNADRQCIICSIFISLLNIMHLLAYC